MLRPAHLVLFTTLLIAEPGLARAAVTINEVAWMGTLASPNDEWIELYNNGESEAVDGWILSDGADLSITLTGTIPAGSYAVLERTDDATLPGAAFLTYTGSLVNTGATLTLFRADGSVADQVVGGADWSALGGDNLTKDTAQYTPAGWITAPATPGAVNASSGSSSNNSSNSSGTKSTAPNLSTADKRTVSVALPKPEPSQPIVTITIPTQAYVNQIVTGQAVVSGASPAEARLMRHTWNFGDLGTTTGKNVTHRFSYPGEYVVSVQSSFRAFNEIQRLTVTVLPTSLSLTRNLSGDLQVHNNAKYETDVSHFTVAVGSSQIKFPTGTFLLPGATLTVPKQRLGLNANLPVLVFDAAQELILAGDGRSATAAALASAITPVRTVAQANTSAPVEPRPTSAPDNFSFISASPAVTTTETATDTLVASPGSINPGVLSSPAWPPWLPYAGLIGLIGLAGSAIVVGRRPTGRDHPLPHTVEDEPFPFI